MPTNLELKIRIDSHQTIKKILDKLNAQNKGILNQKDVYYSIPDGLLKLRIENGSESLIFYNRNEKDKKRWSDYEVVNLEKGRGEKFLSKLFKVEVVVKKKRELFYYDDTRIHLDKVDSLGKFLELETLVIKGKSDAEKRFNKIIELLNLDVTMEIRKSYKDLLMKIKK